MTEPTNKLIQLRVATPIWRVIEQAAKAKGIGIRQFVLESVWQSDSVVSITSRMKKKLKLPGKQVAKPPSGAPARIVKLLKRRGPMSIPEIVDALEPKSAKHVAETVSGFGKIKKVVMAAEFLEMCRVADEERSANLRARHIVYNAVKWGLREPLGTLRMNEARIVSLKTDE